MVNNDSRHNVPDIMKGILILCVVFGHSLSMVNSIRNVPWSQSIVNVFFTSFEMPGFSLLSGYFLAFSLEHRSICQVLKRRLFRYLPVLLIWCAVPIIIKAFFHLPAFSIRNICIDIIDSISSGKLWYIFSYIFCTTLFCLFLIIETKITKREIKIIFRILGCIMLLVFIHTSPISFGYSTYLLPFFFVGYIMRIILNKHSLKIGKVNRTVAIIGSMLFPILLFFYKADYSFYLCDQKYIILYKELSIYDSCGVYIHKAVFLCTLWMLLHLQ